MRKREITEVGGVRKVFISFFFFLKLRQKSKGRQKRNRETAEEGGDR